MAVPAITANGVMSMDIAKRLFRAPPSLQGHATELLLLVAAEKALALGCVGFPLGAVLGEMCPDGGARAACE